MAIYDISAPKYVSSLIPPAITCIWNHPTLGPIPFTAMPTDSESYGVEMYYQLANGDYGAVVSYEDAHYYSTINNNSWNGMTGIPMGALMLSPTGSQPPNSTNIEPMLAGPGSETYWYGGQWETSYFDPAVYNTVASAQAYLNGQTALVASNAVDNQLRGYSEVQIRTAPDITALITFDYAPMTLGAYQTFIDGQVAARNAIVNGATILSQLFSFNPSDLDTVP